MKLAARTALLMTVPPILWAGNAVVGRLLVGSVPPLTLNFLRWLLAALILLPLAHRLMREGVVLRERAGQLAWLGLLGVATYNAMQYLALETSTPLNVTLIAASMPVWMLAIGALRYGVRPTPRQLAGAALSIVGVGFVIARGSWATLRQVQFVPGDLYMLVAIVAWAFYSWLLVRPPAPHATAAPPQWDWAMWILAQTLFGLVPAAASSAAELAAGAEPVHWTPGVVLALAYVAIGPSIVAFRCWGLGVAQAGPALAALFGNLTPLFAALLSTAVFGEWPHGYHGVAFALIIAGIVVSTGGRARGG